MAQQFLVAAGLVHVRSAGDHERVDGRTNRGDRARRELQPAAGQDGAAARLTTWVRYEAAGRNRVALENTSSGPVTSRICAVGKVTITISGSVRIASSVPPAAPPMA